MVSTCACGFCRQALRSPQVQPDPHFRPSDIKNLGYPADPRITKYPLFQTLLDRLKPVKASYEHNLQYDLRRYVFDAGARTSLIAYAGTRCLSQRCRAELPCETRNASE